MECTDEVMYACWCQELTTSVCKGRARYLLCMAMLLVKSTL